MSACLIHILPANVQYQASSENSILSEALSQRLFLQHSCQKGQCGVCSADVLSGTVKNELGELVSSGPILTCCSYAQGDVSLKANYYPQLAELECKTLPCKVAHYQRISDDILLLTLRIPPTAQFHYLPGQYIDLSWQGVRRSYSIANQSASSGEIELHIRLLNDGELSQLLENVTLNQLMRLEGPKGTFFIREAENPLIFLAGGTGFAPVKAMVESLIAQGISREMHIYWGMPNAQNFYSHIAEEWAATYAHVTYVPVVSQAHWHGRTGLVHEAVLEDFSTLAPYHVYACGSPLMLDAAEKTFIQHGLLKDHFYKDAFVSSN